MEFGLSEQQRLLQDSLNKFLEETSSLENVREAIEDKGSAASDIRQGLTDLGANGMLVPEEYGGLGLTLLDGILVQEMLGRYVTPALFSANCMGVAALLGSGTKAQKQTLLPHIANGAKQFGIAMSERTGAREGAGVTSADGGLSGKALFVTGCRSASDFIVCDIDGRLHHVEASQSGLTKSDLSTIDETQEIGELIFDGVTSDPLDAEPTIGATADRVIGLGRVLIAADILGACQMMIEKSVAYAKERKQFNRLIGSFQAVKHLCAEMAAELEPCRSLVWYAAHTYDAMPEEFELMSCHAKSHLSEVGQFVARTATEVHGGVGFTDIQGLHFWFKRIGLNRQLLGGPSKVREQAARLQGFAAA
jgi:alkylation response protein AidB-like acyl-CoA dehydrogenase